VRSARKLVRLARQEPTFVYLPGGGRPNYWTLARFRRENAAGFSTLSLRGLARAAGEYLLACLAHNLGKLLRVCPLPAARPAPAAA
jgi:hypothetical protein